MKIEITNVVDRNIVQDDEAFKLIFAENIIEFFTPLFYEEIRKKQRVLKRNVLDIKKLNQDFLDTRTHLKKLNFVIEREKLKSQLLKEIERLSNVDVIYGSNRALIKNVLMTLNKQTRSQMLKNLKILQNVIKDKK